MLIVLVALYAFACLTSHRTATLLLGTVFAALLHPAAALTALLVTTTAFAVPQGTRVARIYALLALALIALKNSAGPDYAGYLVGVSFVLFQGYYTFVTPPHSVLAIPGGAAHLLFYPQLLCGPIIPPKAYEQHPMHRRSNRRTQYGHCLFAAGMILKIWCSDVLAQVTSSPMTGPFHGLILMFQLYADFAGWCLMGSAIGLASGIAIPRNFRFPLRRRTVARFWAAWNTTLNQWVRTALPLRSLAPHLGRFGAVVIYCGVLALWHGLFLNFALFMAANIVFFWWQARLHSPSALRMSTVLFYMTIGLMFFGRMPGHWIGIEPQQIDQILLASAVVLAFEAGAIARVFKHRSALTRMWWLMPAVIALLALLRPAGKAFMYTRF